MQILIDASVVLLAYIFGSIPFGLLIVKIGTGKDIRAVASGRTGGTNAARAGGAIAGMLTALMDALKGAAAVWVAQAVSPGNTWLHVLAPIAAVLGHNYSVFLTERDAKFRLRFRGGAGGGPTVGGAFGLWWPSALVVLPLGALVFFGIGYASVTTMSAALIITAVFAVRYALGLAPLPYVFYGLIAFVLLVWALRPNIRALLAGKERFHGWRPWKKGAEAPFSVRSPEVDRVDDANAAPLSSSRSRRTRRNVPSKKTAPSKR